MGRQMRMPGGVMFDPETGEFTGGSVVRTSAPARALSNSTRITLPGDIMFDPETGEFTGEHFGNNYRRQSLGLWERFDLFISRIGNWFAGNSESTTNRIAFALYWLSWIGFGIGVISTWIDQGFIWAVVLAIFGGGIFYYISTILLGIFIWIMNIVMFIVRYIFWNAVTFLITAILGLIPILIVLTFGIVGIIKNVSTNETRPRVQTEAVSNQPNYICIADVLNIRSAASAKTSILGQLRKEDEVYVYSVDQTSGFAKIDFNGGIAYVSAKYLAPKESSRPSVYEDSGQIKSEEQSGAVAPTASDKPAPSFTATQAGVGQIRLKTAANKIPAAVEGLYDKVTPDKEEQYFDGEKYTYDILRFTHKGSAVMVATIYDGLIGAIDVVGANVRSPEGFSPGTPLATLVGAGAYSMTTNDMRIYFKLGELLYTINGELTVDGFRKVQSSWQSGATVRLGIDDYDPGARIKSISYF